MRKKIISASILLLILLGGFYYFTYSNLDIIINQEDLECNVFENCELDKSAGYYNDVLVNLRIDDNINTNILGTYNVDLEVSKYFVKKTKSIEVNVVDNIAPEIKLLGSEMLLSNDEKIIEPGYIINDNYDIDLDIQITNTIDKNTEGIYEIEYKVIDQSGNITYAYRNIWVDNNFEYFDFDNEDFKIPNNISVVSETNKLAIDDINDYLFIGDSIIRNLGYNNKLPGTSVLAYPALTPGSMYNKECTYDNKDYNTSTYMKVAEIEPENIIFNFGVCALEINRIDFVLESFAVLFNDIGMYAPGADLYMVSILPIQANQAGTKPNNETINTMNYLLAILCEENSIPFINVAEVLKDKNGLGFYDYYDESGYHLSEKGEEVYIDYILNHLGE
jgi:hypothetical protein